MNKFTLPKIGLGTWGIGGKHEADTSKDAEMISIIHQAFDLGYRHIDTAAIYAAGHAETLIGKALKRYKRDEFIIASKVYKHNLHYDDFIKSIEGSLRRLDIDCIDLCYIHSPNPEIPLQESMQAMDTLVERGLVKHIAVSNFTIALLEEAQSYTQNPIVANQIEYSLLTRETGKYGNNHSMESQMLPYCQERGIYVVAERPVERGKLLTPHPLMEKMAAKYQKSYAQIAINWLISQPYVVTIPKSSNPVHLEDNFAAGTWQMEAADIELLRREYIPLIPNQDAA